MKFRFLNEEKEYEVNYISKNDDGSISLFSNDYNKGMNAVVDTDADIEVTEKDVITYSTEKIDRKKYYYFMSYSGTTLGETVYGYVFFDTMFKIKNKEDINFVIQDIEQKQKIHNLNILNINLLDIESENTKFERPHQKYYYFISYMKFISNKMICENESIESCFKIKTLKDLESTIKNIKRSGCENVVFLSINLLDTEF